MANPPPPYDNITGISRTVMKDNAQESIANYNGNARPGEMVVDLLNNDVYIGNTNGNLNLLVIGGGSGNSEPAGPVGAIQYNSGGNLFGGTANVTVSGSGLNVVGTLSTGNIIPAADNVNFLGNATNRWANIFLGPGTLYMTDSNIASNATAELTVLNGVLQVNGAAGLQANLVSGNTTITLIQSGNITLNAGGSTAEMVVSSTGAAVTGNLAVSNNISANGVATFNGNVSITDAKTLTVGGITTLNGNVAVAAGKTLKVGSNSVVTTSSREFDPAFIDAAGAFRGATATGNYTLHDNLCYFRINIDFATCTNFGSGQYQVTLPFKSIATMTQRSGTLHQTTGDTRYHIAGIVDLQQHSGNPGETMLLYYSGGASDLAWEVGRPAGATTVTSHFDISGWYQIA
jgi:hypothetical protein